MSVVKEEFDWPTLKHASGTRVRLVCDSLSPDGVRLSTLEVKMPRFILAEVNTHRQLCLAGDVELHFDDLGVRENGQQVGKMSISAFYRKWHCRAAHAAKDHLPLSYPLQHHLRMMRLRCVNEATKEIISTRVIDVWKSGTKQVFEVELENGKTVACSKDHLFFTETGWLTLQEATGLNVDASGLLSWDPQAPSFATNGQVVYKAPERLRSRGGVGPSTVTDLCKVRHLIVKWSKVKSIRLRGLEETYDLEVEGPWHNFIANGVVVHNSRNSSSSRAIPVAKIIKAVKDDPFSFSTFFRNQKGMAVSEPLPENVQEEAQRIWLETRDLVVAQVERLLELDVSKGQANRLLEPFMFQTALVTATDWSNMIALRAHLDAQPEFQHVAELIRELLGQEKPRLLGYDQWHLPLVHEWEKSEFPLEELRLISAGRCARVSYVTHDGNRDPQADLTLANNLISGGHMSPLEHPARPLAPSDLHLPWLAFENIQAPASLMPGKTRCGNFRGWLQLRKLIPYEADFAESLARQ